MNNQFNLLSSVLLVALIALCISNTNSQSFSEQEKNQIIAKHRQQLADETVKIFENQFKQKQNTEIYSQLMNYKGLYENLEINDIKATRLLCNDQLQGQLSGFDYKRHNNQNYLLCFSNSSFTIQRFIVEGNNVKIEATNSGNNRVDANLQQAIFYRDYETDTLFVAVLLKQESRLFSVKIFEVNQVKVVEKEVVDIFDSTEDVVCISVIHLVNNQLKIIALIDSWRSEETNFKIGKYHEKILKVSVGNAIQLQTMQIQTQSFIIVSNTSHWAAYSYNNEEPKLVNMFFIGSPIRDIKIFNNGHRYYVGIVCQNQQLIYQWKDQRFQGVALMSFKKVYKMSAITISYAREDNFFYFDQYGTNSIDIYAYDITNSGFVKLQTFSKSSIGFENVVYNSRYSNFFFDHNIAFELKLSGSQIFVYSYNTSITQNKKTNFAKSNLHYLQKYDKSIYEKKIADLHQNIQKLEKTVTISKKSVNMNITFNVEFRAKVIVNKFESNDRKLPEKMYINKRSFENKDLLVTLDKLKSLIDKVYKKIEFINGMLDHEVVYRSRDMKIGGIKEFISHVLAVKVKSKVTNIGTYKGTSVSDILSNLYRTSNNAIITGHKTFHSQVLVNKFLKVNEINRIKPNNFMYASLDQVVYTNLWYKSLKANDLLVGNRLAPNISFSNSVLINQEGDPEIEIRNRIIFEHLSVGNLTINKIDNVSISELPNQVFQRNSPNLQMFQIPTQLASLSTRSDINANFINGYSASKIFDNLIFKNGITHYKNSVHFNGDLNINYLKIDGRLNGLRIPDDLLDRNSDQIVYGTKTFRHAVFNNINAKSLNNLNIPNDIVTLTKDEVVSTPLVVDSLQLDSNIQIDGLIDGINLTHLDQKFIASLNNRFQNITFHKEVNVSSLKVSGHINGLNIEEIYRNALFKNERNLIISSNKTFTSPFKCHSIQADTINGEYLNNFVTTFEQTSIPGKVVFEKTAQFNNIELKSKLDGVDVHNMFNNIVNLDKDLILNGNKNFTDVILVKYKIFVEGLINGMSPSSFMLYSRPQNITGHSSFRQVHINHLHSNGNMWLSRFANNKNFSQLASTRIDLNKPRLINAILRCIDCKANQIVTNYVNRKNFTHFTRNYLSKSQSQVVHGNKNFQTLQKFGYIQTKNGISGINFREINRNAITLKGYNIIHNKVILHGDLKMVDGMLNAKRVNNINIVDFSRKVVYANSTEQIRIHGNTIFKNGFDMHSNINVKRLNNFVPEELIMTKNRDYKIRSNFHFLGKVIVSGNLSVVGTINQVDLAQLDKDILKINEHGEIEGSVNFLQNLNIKEINVNGMVDGIKLNRESILMTDTEQRVNRLIVNGGLHFNESINVLSHINNYPKDTLNNIILINSDQNQVINATKTFVSVEANEIIQSKGDVHIDVVNGINLRHFQKHAVYSKENRNIVIKQHFRDNLNIGHKGFQVRGLVNGIDLLRDVVRLDASKQNITGVKTFENIVLNDDIQVHGNVNAFDIVKIYNSLLYTFGSQHIKNRIVFKAPVFLKSNNTVQLINNVKPNDLVTLNDNQEISGRIVFDSIVANKIYPNNQVNGVDLNYISKNAFFKDADHEQVFNGTLDIKNATFNKDVELQYRLNNVDLSVAIDKAKSRMNQTLNMQNVHSTMQQFTSLLKNQIKQYEHANFEIEYFTKSNMTAPFNIGHKFNKLSLEWRIKGNNNLKLNNRETVWFKHANSRNSSDFKILWHQHQWYVTETVHIDQHHISLEIIKIHQNANVERIYQEKLESNVVSLVFFMDNAIHILYGTQYHSNTDDTSCFSQAVIPTILKRIEISYSDLSNSKHVIQTFPELNIFNLGHYSDENDYHHLLINHHSIDSEKQIKIYKRYNKCLFKLFQAIPAQNVESIALFKFGTPNLIEQYLATLNATRLTVWKQRGMSGFVPSWPIEVSTINKNGGNSKMLTPFVNEQNRLILYAPTCPNNIFEAHLNGLFSIVKIIYDDYV